MSSAHPEQARNAEPDLFDDPPEVPDHVMREVPKGAVAVAGVAVGTLMLAWLAIYFFVFLPRGMVG